MRVKTLSMLWTSIVLCFTLFMGSVCAKEDVQQMRASLEKWLAEECSFSLEMEYRNFVFDGYLHEIHQETASDGSFHFVSVFKQWDRPAFYEYEERAEYYYRFEDGDMVCYMKINDQEPSRGVLSSEETQMLWADKQRLIATDVLLPKYTENFELKKSQEDEKLTIGSFSLPLKRILEEQGMMANLIYNAMAMSGKDAVADQEVFILAELIVETDTFKPLSLTFSFDELKPYLFSEGALSGEFALGMNLMSMTYQFDYHLPDEIAVPDEFIP